MKRLLWWFSATVVVGVLISVVPARIYTAFSHEAISGTITPTDFEKQYVEQFTDRIKWLETIAYAATAGIIGLRWSQEKLVAHPAIATSAGCLVVSLFDGYSAHDQVLQALETHTPYLLAGAVSRWTVGCQFWILAIAVFLLAMRLLSVPRRMRRGALSAIAIIGGSMSMLAPATAAAAPQQIDVNPCITDWVQTRFQAKPSGEELGMLAGIVSGTAKAKKIDLSAQNGCPFSASVLDFVLNGSYFLNGDRKYADFLQLAQDVSRGINNPGAGESPIVRSLLSLVEIWHNARGIVYVTSARPGDQVYIGGKQVGLTPLTCAIAPGDYELRVSRNGAVIDAEKIEVKDGIQLQRNLK